MTKRSELQALCAEIAAANLPDEYRQVFVDLAAGIDYDAAVHKIMDISSVTQDGNVGIAYRLAAAWRPRLSPQVVYASDPSGAELEQLYAAAVKEEIVPVPPRETHIRVGEYYRPGRVGPCEDGYWYIPIAALPDHATDLHGDVLTLLRLPSRSRESVIGCYILPARKVCTWQGSSSLRSMRWDGEVYATPADAHRRLQRLWGLDPRHSSGSPDFCHDLPPHAVAAEIERGCQEIGWPLPDRASMWREYEAYAARMAAAEQRWRREEEIALRAWRESGGNREAVWRSLRCAGIDTNLDGAEGIAMRGWARERGLYSLYTRGYRPWLRLPPNI